MADEIDLIRSRIDIVELVAERVSLKRAGKNWKGLCPFHQDKNPSFNVNPSIGRYKCFSCGAGGDCFTWLMETERVEFPEALRELAKRAGVELTARTSNPEAVSKKEVYERAMAAAQAFFRAELAKSPTATNYCDGRTLDKGVRDLWEMGYAPDAGDRLATYLKKEGFRLADCRDLFLVDEDSSGGYYDRFRGRLMFPIRDERGNLVAFGGRLLGDGTPKYINSSDTPLYLKRRVLYGMHEAKDAISRTRKAILVEGYLDVIACHRAGLDNAVASLGTSLSEEHAKLLSRWCDDVLVLYDNDQAGLKAAMRAIPILEDAGLRVRISLVPEGKDPDSLLRVAGADAVKALNVAGLTPLEFRIAEIERRLDPATDEFWREVVAALALCTNDLEITRQLLPLAILYPEIRDPDSAQKSLRAMIIAERKKAKKQVRTLRTPDANEEAVPQPNKKRIPLMALNSAERSVFAGLLSPNFAYSAWRACFDPTNFISGAGAHLAAVICEVLADAPPEGGSVDWLNDLPDEDGSRELMAELAFQITSKDLHAEFEESLSFLRSRKESRAVAMLRAEGVKDDGEMAQIAERLRVLKHGDGWDQ